MKIALIKGDGIGPEISEVATKVLKTLVPEMEFVEVEAGEQALAKHGNLLPEQTLNKIKECGFGIKGPLNTPIGGGFKSINVTLRQHFELYSNIRPVKSYPNASSRFSDVNIVLFRENVEGMYSGEGQISDGERAESKSIVTRKGSERIVRSAFEYAIKNGRQKVTIVHKANILKSTSGLFLKTAQEVAQEYPQIKHETMIVDACAMNLVRNPANFDVIVTTNLFGDILSDLCAGLVGGLGLAPGANEGNGVFIVEAVHGTAPDIAGQNKANPTALILSCKMLLDRMGKAKESEILEKALVKLYTEKTELTRDVGGNNGTQEFGDALIREIKALQ